MRRREKYIRNGAAIGGGLLAVYDVFNQMSEQNAKGEKLTMENFDWIRTMKKAGYGLAFGGTAGFLYYLYKIQKEKSIPFNADEYRRYHQARTSQNPHPALLEKALRYREILKSQFYKEFEFQLAAFPLQMPVHYLKGLPLFQVMMSTSYLSSEKMLFQSQRNVLHRKGFPGKEIWK